MPRASPAAMAEDIEQPVPCVFSVAILGAVLYLQVSRVDVIDGDDGRAVTTPGAGRDDSSRHGLLQTAVVVGLLFWFIINKTRFGFDLRATGMNEDAAVASGVSVKKMVVTAMMLSGAVAGLIWLPNLFAETASGNYFSSSVFQSNLGFTGIAVALLGRNTAIGTFFSALLFGALLTGTSVRNLDPLVFPPELATALTSIIQGLIVLFVSADILVVYLWRLRRRLRRRGPAESEAVAA